MKNNRILYIEALRGASGDMMLGALIDLDVPVEVLSDAWTALGIENYEIEVFDTQKAGMRALQCRVKTQEKAGPKTWKQYQKILKQSKIKPQIKTQALKLSKKIFEVEASIHGTTLEKCHLHEMGGTDLLIDLVGTLSAVDFLNPARIVSSPINTGTGFVEFSHGKYPVPPPAAAEMLKGAAIFHDGTEGELTTPTGALLITHLASEFGPMPVMTLRKIGVGAGEKEFRHKPNVIRIFDGAAEADSSDENVFLFESNIDDSNPQLLALFMEKAFEAGALDVFFTPIFMKKNRPGTRVSTLVEQSRMQEIVELLFRETTAIGLRYWKVDRQKLNRRWKEVEVQKQKIRIKESYSGDMVFNYQPEYEDCKAAAIKLKKSVKEIAAAALHKYLSS